MQGPGSSAAHGSKPYVSMSWLLDRGHHHWQQLQLQPASSSSQQSQWLPALPLMLPRMLERLRMRHRPSWQAVLAAAALGANVCALAYLARRAYNIWAEQQEQQQRKEEEHQELMRAALAYLQRLWDVATQAGAAGSPADLGRPDADGVYTYEGRGGAKLYFRVAPRPPGSSSGPEKPDTAPLQWQWSTSKRLWLPTSAADSIWCDSGDRSNNPGLGGRLLIRRLELESQLVCGARCRVACVTGEPLKALPPLELPAMCSKKAKAKAAAAGSGAAAVAAAINGLVSPRSPALNGNGGLVAEVPDSFICPLSQRVMTDPVVTPGGITYDRVALRDWIERNGSDPVTGHPLSMGQLYANLNLRDQICGYFLVREWMSDISPRK